MEALMLPLNGVSNKKVDSRFLLFKGLGLKFHNETRLDSSR